MSGRRIEVSGTQVMASVLATITGAIAASYLGIAGTIIGAAVMSVASTAGSAVYKHYLGRTAGRLREAAPVIAHRAAERMTAVGAHGTTQQRAHANGAGVKAPTASGNADDVVTETLPAQRGPGDKASPATQDGKHGGRGGETSENHRPAAAPSGRPGSLRRGAAWPHRGAAWPHRATAWLHRRPGWLLVTVASLGIFLGVIGGISGFELVAGKPLDAVVWHRSGSGTTVGGIVGGQSAPKQHTAPATRQPSSPASPSPSSSQTSPASPSPSPTPSSGSPSPSQSPSPSPSTSGPSTSPSPTRAS